MTQQLWISGAVLALALGTGLNVQAQTAPVTTTTPGTITTPTTTPGTTTPGATVPNSMPTNSAPSFFVPGTNPSGSINYNQSTTINSSGFSVPTNTLPRTTPTYGNTTPNTYNSTLTNPGGTINAFPTYNPYTINPPQSIYNPSLGNPSPSITTPSNGFGVIR